MKPENGIVRILKQEGTEFLSVMPVANITTAAARARVKPASAYRARVN